MKKCIAVSVSNDLSTDQRVRKQCQSLSDAGYDVLLIGRKMPQSLPIERTYKFKRISLLFNRKALFYAELNLRLLVLLLFSKADLYYANDLDTLAANTLAAWLRRKPMVYDSHEYFTEVPEIQSRPWVKKIWKFIERSCIGKASLVLTVNKSIAILLQDAYQLKDVQVVRNVPDGFGQLAPATRAELGLPADMQILILQGSGINTDRGAEELLEAMAFMDGTILLVIGGGDAMPALRLRAQMPDLAQKVIFKPRMPYSAMMRFTALADLGLSLDKDSNINYRYSLPNKVFDYVGAGIPMLVSDLVEVRNFVLENDLGVVASQHDPRYLSGLITATLADTHALARFRKNALRIRMKLHWQDEYKVIENKITEILDAK
jgi:glycosyltransferase involved in cell wall biosynthesis